MCCAPTSTCSAMASYSVPCFESTIWMSRSGPPRCLMPSTTSLVCALPFVAALFATDVGFINFHSASELQPVRLLHRFPDPMRQIPCGAVVHLQMPLKLQSTH